jgi:hypothetical protein
LIDPALLLYLLFGKTFSSFLVRTRIDGNLTAIAKLIGQIEDFFEEFSNVSICLIRIDGNLCSIDELRKDGEDRVDAVLAIFIDFKAFEYSPNESKVSA